jgi:NitT/TauT family transport system substrate-binding protein
MPDTQQTNNLNQPETPAQPLPDTAGAQLSAQNIPPQAPKQQRWLLWGLAVLILVAGAATFLVLSKKDKSKPTATNQQLTKVNVHLGWLHQAQFAGFYVAKEKGYYKDAGLDVDLHEFQDNEDVNHEIAEGKVDFGTTTPLEVLASRDKGDKIKAIAAIYQTSPYSFVSPKSSNIKTPADLKGKVIGYVGNNTEAQVAYPALLSAYGISTSQVTVKDIDFDIVKNFQTHTSDTADVYRTDQTYLLDKAGIAYNILQPEQFGFNIYGDVIITSDNTTKNRPGLAAKFTQATLKGTQYALDHQADALAMTAKYENPLYKDPAYESYILKNSTPLIRPTGGQPLGNMQFVPWNRAYQAIKSAGLLKSNIEVSDLYTSEFVK